jgi:hypothetical protein
MSERLSLAGDEPAEPEEKPAGKSKKKRGGDEPSGARTRRRHDADVRGKLESVFERLAEWREGRGDIELAEIIREDAAAMTGGLVALTRPLEWLRGPLVFVLAIVEPALAFGRILRVVAGRWAERRARIAYERELEAEPPPEPGPDEPPPAWPPQE